MKPGDIILEEYCYAGTWHRLVFESETCQIRCKYQLMTGDSWHFCANEFHLPVINEEEQ